MASAEHPITRSELREELRHYATKDDLNLYRSELREELGLYRSELREELRHYATKEDVANLETRLTREISDLKSEFSEFKVEVKGDVNTLIKWMVGVQVGGIAAIAAIATAIVTITKILGG